MRVWCQGVRTNPNTKAWKIFNGKKFPPPATYYWKKTTLWRVKNLRQTARRAKNNSTDTARRPSYERMPHFVRSRILYRSARALELCWSKIRGLVRRDEGRAGIPPYRAGTEKETSRYFHLRSRTRLGAQKYDLEFACLSGEMLGIIDKPRRWLAGGVQDAFEVAGTAMQWYGGSRMLK